MGAIGLGAESTGDVFDAPRSRSRLHTHRPRRCVCPSHSTGQEVVQGTRPLSRSRTAACADRRT